ncbi:LysR family transcriptional regulator [Nocardioides sp. GY 10113]|uniref:LysR family transcriptional regulator n=1 Tax=Nocardioides sp. GY 10113 TaxID=2569761 RepID=UPI0010A84E95|nr:LysR family transcriptional regulator [Nocardioides sp. GY 10113]TIC79238.1 LysR family transcriptional regulator [Nocardioides sp. GY 10113]
MQLRHVEYFVATAETGSVSAAAAQVHVAQPALSRQLRQLEQDLGVALFDRAPGRLALSRTGLALLPVARELLAAADALERAAHLHARGRVERLTIAAPTATLTDIVSPFVATMSPEDPVVDVRVADGPTVEAMLRAGADLAIGMQRPQAPLVARALATFPVWAYVPRSDPWSERGSVRLAELLERPLIGLPASFTSREALERAVAAAGTSYSTLVEAANGTIAQALAASGRGVAVVSDDPRFDLVPLAVDLGDRRLSIRLVVAWDGSSVAADTLAGLAARIADWVAERYPTLPR